ncbi:MAG: sulfate respiration complex iron-sulfur protein HmcB [Desulfovibrionaceae bacterium]|nr:4Fe-4S dicluster domain-containing protein [Desulfovibrionaceae bacterium]
MNRRKFLTVMGSAGVASALGAATTDADAASHTYPYYEDSYGVLHDTTRCIGCRRCEKACQQVNNLPMPEKPFEDLSVTATRRRTSAYAWTVVNKYKVGDVEIFRKLQCLHCNDPACASACFAKCFQKMPDGTVHYEGSQCVGCRYCMVACPFYVPGFQYDEAWDPLVQKCTFCQPRTQKGQLPGCVEACPMDALTFGKRKDLIAIAKKRIAENPDKYVNYIYGEHDAGGTAWLTLSGVKPDKLGMDTHLGNSPMGELTYGALGAVPMIIGFWPVVFGGVYGVSKAKDAYYKREKEKAAKAAMEAALKKVEETQGADAAAKVREALAQAQEHGCSCKHGEDA